MPLLCSFSSGERMSLREIIRKLADAGFYDEAGEPYAVHIVAATVGEQSHDRAGRGAGPGGDCRRRARPCGGGPAGLARDWGLTHRRD